MTTLLDNTTRSLLQKHNLPVGTTLENRVTLWLYHRGVLDQFHCRIGKYRLDYAWPAKLIALEADGPHHWRPDVAVKDVIRDCWLRSQGWLVFRVDDVSGEPHALEKQLCRVVQMVNLEDDDWAKEARRIDGLQR